MKKIVVLLLLYSVSTIAQQVTTDHFEFNTKSIDYTIYDYDTTAPVDFYVVISQDSVNLSFFKNRILDCFNGKDKYIQFYFILIPVDLKEQQNKKEQFFLDFITYITNRIKIEDSNLHILSDKNYTELYYTIQKEKHGYYQRGIMNDIVSNTITIPSDFSCITIRKTLTK